MQEAEKPEMEHSAKNALFCCEKRGYSQAFLQNFANFITGQLLAAASSDVGGIRHGAGLAVIHPVLYRHIYKSGAARFARFAQNVWGIAPKGCDDETASAGVDTLAAFIKEIGLPTTFAELGIPANTDFRAIADSTVFTEGCCKKLTHDEIYDILCECK